MKKQILIKELKPPFRNDDYIVYDDNGIMIATINYFCKEKYRKQLEKFITDALTNEHKRLYE